MRSIVIASCLIAIALAAPGPDAVMPEKPTLPAILHEEIRDELGQYTLHYVTPEGTEVNEKGKLIPTADGSSFVLEVVGETKFIGDDGKVYVTKYSAGLNGTHVEGDHLPVPVVALPEPSTAAPEEPKAL